MKLLSFEEFMKSNVSDNSFVEDKCDRIADALAKQTSKMFFVYLECYHNWLTEQLGSNSKSTETDTE